MASGGSLPPWIQPTYQQPVDPQYMLDPQTAIGRYYMPTAQYIGIFKDLFKSNSIIFCLNVSLRIYLKQRPAEFNFRC